MISKEEIENIIEYDWDKGLHGVEDNQLPEGFYLTCKLPESSIARHEELNVSLRFFML
jgi:hypothetical protein